jgi:NADH-quinone oxidoreductase subunit D
MARVEDPRGEGMMYAVGDGTDRPYRLKIRSPIFVTVSAAPKFLVG